MGLLDWVVRISRERALGLGRPERWHSTPSLAEWTDEQLEEELLRRRRLRASRTSAAARPNGPDEASPQEKQLEHFYSMLGLAPDASLQAVRRAYRSLIRRYHPDHHTHDPDHHRAATELSDSLTRAYRALLSHLGSE